MVALIVLYLSNPQMSMVLEDYNKGYVMYGLTVDYLVLDKFVMSFC